MEGHVNCIVHRPVGSLGKLQGVPEVVSDGFEVCQHQALEILPTEIRATGSNE